MSLLFGSGKRQKPQYSSLQVQTSSSNMPVTLAWGLCRLSPNIIWYGDFKSHKQKQGGKGGGGKGGGQYTYTTALQMALCQGVSSGIQRVFVDNDKTATLAKLNLVFFSGTDTQSPWSYLTTNHPTEALNYPGLVHVDSPKYDLGSSASLPQHSFETECRLYNTAPGGTGDADVALVIQDYLTAPIFGCGFPSDEIDTVSLLSGPDAGTTGDAAAETYCTAMGFGMSPVLSSQENGLTLLKRWCDIFNIAPVWNGDTFKFIPYALEGLSGNGVVFVPNSVSAYSLTDKDYVGSPENPDDPVLVKRVDFSKVKNRLQVEILSREKEYNAVPLEYVEQGLVDQYGDLPDGLFQAHEVTQPDMGATIAAIMCVRNAFRGANAYTFKLGPEFCLLEPMDLLDVFDPEMGLVQVQIDVIDEDDDFNITYTASMVSAVASNSGGQTAPDQTPGGNNTGVSAGDVNTPIIFEPPSSLAGDAEVWMAVSGPDPNWGGCNVWVSSDNATYTEIGTVEAPARMGLTTGALAAYAGANPDTAHSVGVDLSESLGELTGVSATDAANLVTLCYLGGELLSFRDAVLTSTSHYTLSGQLYRGLYGTAPGAHLSGVPFARLDSEIFKYALPSQYIGQTLYFKFQSFNVFGGAVEDLSLCTAYTYAPTGGGYGTGTAGAPATPTGLSSSSGSTFAKIIWTANSVNDNVQLYEVWRATGSSQPFGSASKIGTTTGSSYTDLAVVGGQAYTYFVIARNEIGASPNSSGINATPAVSTSGVLRLYGELDGRSLASQVMFDIEMVGDESFSTAFAGSLGSCAVAPTGAVTLAILKNGVSVGSMNIAAGATTATFTLASGLTFSAGDRFSMLAPSTVDATLSGVRFTFVGRRG